LIGDSKQNWRENASAAKFGERCFDLSFGREAPVGSITQAAIDARQFSGRRLIRAFSLVLV
jgi:hypothetical protein